MIWSGGFKVWIRVISNLGAWGFGIISQEKEPWALGIWAVMIWTADLSTWHTQTSMEPHIATFARMAVFTGPLLRFHASSVPSKT